LGNRRGSVADLMSKLDDRQKNELIETCRKVANIFPDSIQMGIDVLFTPGFRRLAVLEVNAFGDLLPNVQWNGMDTYEAQIDAMPHWCEKRDLAEPNGCAGSAGRGF
jgi:glutathione synthase/RimK-type ligase-like ATP-grasp enzyme